MKSKIRSIIKSNKIVINTIKSVFFLLTLLPRKKNLIMFESFNGRQYSDNPRAIYEYLKKHYPTYRMVWSADRRNAKQFEGKEIEYVWRFSFKWLFLMPTAKYWVTNSRFPQWFPKSKNTVYLQTWHGTPLKKIGIDIKEVHMPEAETKKYQEEFLFEASKWDYLVSPNSYSTEIFKRAFGFNGKMIESGYPRNDVLINQNNQKSIQELKEKMKLPQDKKIILYAPTWRDDQFYDKGRYKFNIELDLQQMRETLGKEYVILLRMHYLVSENLDLSDYQGFVYDYSSYEDIRDLYIVSDLLITDYSSVFFDYSLLEKPILFYVYDINNYRDQLRGFYFDFESDSPGPLLKTTQEIVEEIQAMGKEGFSRNGKIKEFRERFNSLEDGKATERVIQEVFMKK